MRLLPPGSCHLPASVLTVTQNKLLGVQPSSLNPIPPLLLGKDRGQVENSFISSSRVEGPKTGPHVGSVSLLGLAGLGGHQLPSQVPICKEKSRRGSDWVSPAG